MVQARMEGFKKVRSSGDDLDRVVEKDDSNSSVTTDNDDATRSHLDRLSRLIDTTKFQIIVVCAVALDGFIVVVGLLVAGDGHTTAAVALHYVSVGMLATFILEIVLRLAGLRRNIRYHKMEIFDSLVTVVAFVLGIVFARNEGIRSSVGLIILLRLWRVAQILNGIIRSVRKLADRRLQRERRTRAAVEQELSKFRAYCSAQEREIASLHAALRKHGISIADDNAAASARSLAAAATISVVAEVNNCCSISTETYTPPPSNMTSSITMADCEC